MFHYPYLVTLKLNVNHTVNNIGITIHHTHSYCLKFIPHNFWSKYDIVGTNHIVIVPVGD